MSDSEDDKPLSNGIDLVPVRTPNIVPKADRAKDVKGSLQGHVASGVAVTNGITNGTHDVDAQKNGKRKASAGKSYQEPNGSEDDEPLNKRRRTSGKSAPADSDSDDAPVSKSKHKKSARTSAVKDESDSDAPLLANKKVRQKAEALQDEKHRLEALAEKGAKTSMNGAKKKRPVAADSDDEPIAKKKTATKAKANGIKKEESDDDKPLAKKAAPAKQAKTAAASATPKKKGKAGSTKEDTEAPEGEEDEESYKWWEDTAKGDGSKKWDTLSHNGVIFAPAYEPLPKNVSLIYGGVPVKLDPAAEEVAGFYGTMLHSTVNVENPTFNKNFFNDFKSILDDTGHGTGPKGEKIKITSFEKCDFKAIFQYYDAEREKKRAVPAADKKILKAQKDEVEAPFMYCLWDGRKQKVGNFRVEPPGLFRGRGEHPKTGKVKQRIMPEQVTINIGKEATVPAPPPGHKWKEIKHDNAGTWLAMWQENINGNYKYVMLAASSDVKGQSDHKKFEKARELKKHIGKIRREYQRDLKADLMADRQRATAMYLIDQFALRAGNEKSEDEADTVGCCSLKFEHITLQQPDTVVFDFLGKDSIRFHEEFKVDQQVFKNLRIFKKAPKKDGDEIFDRLTTSSLNKHLSSYMPGLTAKVFRTYNASQTFANLLRELKPDKSKSLPEKMKEYNDANRKVAILCNHRRTVAASHGAQMEKLQDRIDAVRYQQYRLKMMMLEEEPKLKKKRGAEYFELPSGLDKEWQEKHHQFLVEQEREKIKKKFAKDNEKRVAEGEKEMKAKELEERLEVADDLQKKLAKEFKKGKVEVEGKGMTVEKLDEKVEKLQARIETMTIQGEDKKNTSDVALSTSKINYIDPRLSVVFSKKFDIPIEKLFSATLRQKFQWAIESTPDDWEF